MTNPTLVEKFCLYIFKLYIKRQGPFSYMLSAFISWYW